VARTPSSAVWYRCCVVEVGSAIGHVHDRSRTRKNAGSPYAPRILTNAATGSVYANQPIRERRGGGVGSGQTPLVPPGRIRYHRAPPNSATRGGIVRSARRA